MQSSWPLQHQQCKGRPQLQQQVSRLSSEHRWHRQLRAAALLQLAELLLRQLLGSLGRYRCAAAAGNHSRTLTITPCSNQLLYCQ